MAKDDPAVDQSSGRSSPEGDATPPSRSGLPVNGRRVPQTAPLPPLAARRSQGDQAAGKGEPPRAPRSFAWIWAAVAVAALLLALLSLAVNAVLIRELLVTRDSGRQIVDAAIAAVDGATVGDMTFNYVFSDTIVYSGTVPVSETIRFPFQGRVPFQGSVPFQGTVPVAINVPVLGVQRFSVPVNTSVYVDTAVEVSTTVTVPVQMAFPFDVAMPVQMPIDLTISLDEQPALRGMLTTIRAFLIELRTQILE